MTQIPPGKDPQNPSQPNPLDPGRAESSQGSDAPTQRGTPAASRPSAKSIDPDALLLHADKPVPSLDELRAALVWAFAAEEVAPALLDRFAEHARLVLQGNQRMNLTAILEPREVAAKHVLDSWRATRLLPLSGKRVLDLGSGAGYPGIPMALADSQTRVTLVDSMHKRAAFLEECLGQLGLGNASAIVARGEDHLQKNRYDMVVMRSISSVRENVRLLRKVKHSIRDLVMLKGPAWSRETRAAEREAERLGFRLDTVWEHELPGDMGKRAILVYRAPGSQS